MRYLFEFEVILFESLERRCVYYYTDMRELHSNEEIGPLWNWISWNSVLVYTSMILDLLVDLNKCVRNSGRCCRVLGWDVVFKFWEYLHFFPRL